MRGDREVGRKPGVVLVVAVPGDRIAQLFNVVGVPGVCEHAYGERRVVGLTSAAFGSIGGRGDDRGVELAVDVDDEIVNGDVANRFEGFAAGCGGRCHVGRPPLG
jgi:hypothetical protein